VSSVALWTVFSLGVSMLETVISASYGGVAPKVYFTGYAGRVSLTTHSS